MIFPAVFNFNHVLDQIDLYCLSQDQLYNLPGPIQNENQGLWFKSHKFQHVTSNSTTSNAGSFWAGSVRPCRLCVHEPGPHPFSHHSPLQTSLFTEGAGFSLWAVQQICLSCLHVLFVLLYRLVMNSRQLYYGEEKASEQICQCSLAHILHWESLSELLLSS